MKGLVFDFSEDLVNKIKLRKSLQVSEDLKAFVGGEFCLQSHELTPALQVAYTHAQIGVLKAKIHPFVEAPIKFSLTRDFRIGGESKALEIRGKLSYASLGGGLSTKFELKEVQPSWVLFPFAMIAFALKSHVGSSKKFRLHDVATCKLDVTVKKESPGIHVYLNKLNLRLDV